MQEVIFVYMTAKDKEEALRVGRTLVEKRLAACINVWDGMHSAYWWQGKIEESTEAVLIAKTGAAQLEQLIRVVKAVHSYSVPCVVALPALGGNTDYLNWVRENIAG